MKEKSTLSQLGHSVAIAASPEAHILECVPNDHVGTDYVVRFTCPEFTCLCPMTGQPDFAHLVIDFVPGEKLVESKSLKLYFFSFRNHGGFHEKTTIDIAKKLEAAMAPKWLRIGGYWFPRGGMPIDVFYEFGKEPEGLFIPDQGVAPYKGRG